MGVDIYQKGTTYYVGSVEADEWLDFTIDVAEDNDYNITAYMGAATAGGEFELEFGNDTTLAFTADSFRKSDYF